MAIAFDKLPTDKPAGSKLEPGRYNATIVKAEMGTSKSSGDPMLTVTFKEDSTGEFVREFYTESDNTFVLYKIGRLIEACNTKLQGEGTLKDISKVIINKRVSLDVAINDRGYSTLDYSNGHDGIYVIDSNASVPTAAAEDEAMDPELEQAIESDEDF